MSAGNYSSEWQPDVDIRTAFLLLTGLLGVMQAMMLPKVGLHEAHQCLDLDDQALDQGPNERLVQILCLVQ
jgi:hypothetical protein